LRPRGGPRHVDRNRVPCGVPGHSWKDGAAFAEGVKRCRRSIAGKGGRRPRRGRRRRHSPARLLVWRRSRPQSPVRPSAPHNKRTACDRLCRQRRSPPWARAGRAAFYRPRSPAGACSSGAGPAFARAARHRPTAKRGLNAEAAGTRRGRVTPQPLRRHRLIACGSLEQTQDLAPRSQGFAGVEAHHDFHNSSPGCSVPLANAHHSERVSGCPTDRLLCAVSLKTARQPSLR
jgi:hypothetical protein